MNARQELGLLFEYCALPNTLAIGGDMILQQDGSEYIYYMFCQYFPLKRDSSPKYINSFIIYSYHSKPITFSFFCGISKIYIFRNFGYIDLRKIKNFFNIILFFCVCVCSYRSGNT